MQCNAVDSALCENSTSYASLCNSVTVTTSQLQYIQRHFAFCFAAGRSIAEIASDLRTTDVSTRWSELLLIVLSITRSCLVNYSSSSMEATTSPVHHLSLISSSSPKDGICRTGTATEKIIIGGERGQRVLSCLSLGGAFQWDSSGKWSSYSTNSSAVIVLHIICTLLVNTSLVNNTSSIHFDRFHAF